MATPFVGEIRLFSFARIPIGWLACNGQSLAISQYNALYTVIGTTYGGDGIQTFRLPDLCGRVPIGQGQGPGLPSYRIGQAGGEEQHSLIEQEMPQHSHALMSSTNVATAATPAQNLHLATVSSGTLYAPVANAAPYAVMAAVSVTNAGNNMPHDNMMPTVVANYCIATEGDFPSPG